MQMNINIKPAISIIVTAYTKERLGDLTELLRSVREQTYKQIEVILVIERSKELEHEILEHIKVKNYSNVKVVFNPGPWGLSVARNLGIRHASGRVLAFIDDDALLCPNWAEETLCAYENSSVIGVTGPIEPLWESDTMKWFPREMYWIFSCTHNNWNEARVVRNGYGTNISFLKEAFELAGVFLPSLGAKGGGTKGKNEMGGEETEFSIRVKKITGKNIMYFPNVRVKHRVYFYRFTLRFIIKRAFWEGYSKAYFRHNFNPDGNVLSTEFNLLGQIMLRFPSRILKLFVRPLDSFKENGVIAIVLLCVGYGFLKGELKFISKKLIKA